ETSLSETLNRILGAVARYRWLVLIPASLTTFVTLFALSWTPNRYTSEATVLVVQQQVPQRYVLPTSTGDIREALQATTQEVLSRTRLFQIIDQFGLYTKERKSLSPERLLEQMRQDIGIQPIESQMAQKDVNSFKFFFIKNTQKMPK